MRRLTMWYNASSVVSRGNLLTSRAPLIFCEVEVNGYDAITAAALEVFDAGAGLVGAACHIFSRRDQCAHGCGCAG
jgi:hypothetical protein